MTKLELSIYLETISFFLVAIDLYGKNRLEKTHRRIVIFSRFMTRRIDYLVNESWQEKMTRRSRTIILIATFVFSIGSGCYQVLVRERTLGIVEGELLTIAYFSFLSSIAIFMGTMVFIMVSISLLLLVTWFSRKFLLILSKVLNVVNFEGLLLISGAVLFLFSKWLELISQ